METSLIPGGTQEKLKSYWNRPGGKFGTVVLLAALGAIGWYVLPVLTAVVWNAVNFGIACVSAAVLTYCLSHRKLRLSAFYLYEILMKNLVGVVWKIDPFIIADDYISDMEKDREELYKQVAGLEGNKERVALKIGERERDRAKQINLMKVAKNQAENGETAEVKRQGQLALSNAARQEARLADFVRQLTPIQDAMAKVSDHLQKVYTNSAYLIEDARNELEVKKDLYTSVTMGNTGLQRALKLLNGDPEKKLLVAQSMDALKEDIGSKMGNMRLAMRITAEFSDKIDLENATFEQAGLARLEQLSADENFRLNPAGAAQATSTAPRTEVPASYKDLI